MGKELRNRTAKLVILVLVIISLFVVLFVSTKEDNFQSKTSTSPKKVEVTEEVKEEVKPLTIEFAEGIFDVYPLAEVQRVQDVVKDYTIEYCEDKGYFSAYIFDVVKDEEYNSYSVHINFGDSWYQCISIESSDNDPLILYNTSLCLTKFN